MYSYIENITNQNINEELNKQGEQLLNYNKKHFKNINVSRILETCDKTVCSVRETLDKNDSVNVNVSFNNLLESIKTKENKYNRKLKEYTDLQKRINEEMIKKNKYYEENKNFLGKTVENHDTKFYINHYGYTHTYSHDAWDGDNKNCPSSAIPIKSVELNQFTKSVDMNTGQPCHIAGQMIRNKKTSEYAWVDLKGIKHMFTGDIWSTKHKTCKNNNIKVLSNTDFSLIPMGSNMTNHDLCMKHDINPNDYLRLKKINEELIDLAKEISNSMNNVITKDSNINKKINHKKYKLEKYLKDLDNNRDKIDHYNKTLITVNAQEANSSKESVAEYYMFLSWTLMALLIGGLTIKTLSK